jgi:hypothetical protein
MDALELLETLAEIGVVASLDGAALLVKPRGALTDDLRSAIRAQKPALMAILALRAYAETRRRQIHWLCPDRRLFELHRAAEGATGQRLRFDGRGVSTRPQRRAAPLVAPSEPLISVDRVETLLS